MVSEATYVGSFAPNGWAFSTEEQEESGNEEEGECDISLLKIRSRHQQRPVSPAGSTFSLKKYDSFNSSGINFGCTGAEFGSATASNTSQTKKPLVKPPKFVSPRVAQSSWVAGGYWAPPNARFGSMRPFGGGFGGPHGLPVSRCSSQSSGFGSINGGVNKNIFETHGSLPNSRVNSTCNDMDRFSVVSEPAGYGPPPPPSAAVHNSTFSLGRINDTLSFYDVTSTPCPSPLSMTSTTIRRRRPSNDGSLDSSTCSLVKDPVGVEFNPKANSSPKEMLPAPPKQQQHPFQSLFNKKIRIDVSVYSLVMVASVAFNVALTLYYFLS